MKRDGISERVCASALDFFLLFDLLSALLLFCLVLLLLLSSPFFCFWPILLPTFQRFLETCFLEIGFFFFCFYMVLVFVGVGGGGGVKRLGDGN